MRASTHTEVYRPFSGSLREHPRRWITIGVSSAKQGFKRKLPALLLFTPVAIGCVIACFRVYFRFQLLSGELVNISSPGAAGITLLVTETLGLSELAWLCLRTTLTVKVINRSSVQITIQHPRIETRPRASSRRLRFGVWGAVARPH